MLGITEYSEWLKQQTAAFLSLISIKNQKLITKITVIYT